MPASKKTASKKARPKKSATVTPEESAAESFAEECSGLNCGTILADPPWRFTNRTGKVAPEHGRLTRYPTLKL
ncbi:MAG: hypothetical protein ACI93T_003514, partial [Porticoccaceae bacterium]